MGVSFKPPESIRGAFYKILQGILFSDLGALRSYSGL